MNWELGKRSGTLFFLVLLLYLLSVNPAAPKYLGFEEISWQGDIPCSVERLPGQEPVKAQLECLSQPFLAQGTIVELEYQLDASAPGAAFNVSLAGADAPASRPQLLSTTRGFWAPLALELPPSLRGRPVAAAVRGACPACSFVVRPRVNFYRKAQFSAAPLHSAGAIACLSVLIAFFIVLGFKRLASCTAMGFAIFAFGLSFFLYFRGSLFFYWDEWPVLRKYAELGPIAVMIRHNEHFKPLFLSLYYLEAKLFGPYYSAYLVVSLAVHALNSLLVLRLLERLTLNHPESRRSSLIGAAIFAVSGLHVEVNQWAFEQSLLCSTTLSLATLLWSVMYQQEGERKLLLAAAGGAALAPLFFASGFALPLQFVPLALYSSRAAGKDRCKRAAAGFYAVGLGSGAAATLYLMNSAADGPLLEQSFNFVPAAKHLIVSAGLGTVLRGLSLFPALDFFAVKHLAGALQEANLELVLFDEPEMTLAAAGLCLAGFLVAYPLACRRERARLWLLACSGLALIFAALLLPAFGRWSKGIEWALVLRYHYPALCGLAVMIVPAVITVLERFQRKLLIPAAVLVVHFAVQIFLIGRFTHLQQTGMRNRLFVRQLEEFHAPGNYEMEQTQLQPALPEGLAPGGSPARVERTYGWLVERSAAGKVLSRGSI